MRCLFLVLLFTFACCICAAGVDDNDQASSAVVTQNVLLGPVAHYFRIEGVPRSVQQLSLLEIPFLAQNAYAQLWYRDDTITSNPLTPPKYQDFPLFVLYKRTSIQRSNSNESIASRTRCAHTFLGGISLYRNDIWPDHARTGVVNVFDDLSLLYSDREEKGKHDTAFVDLIAGALYRSRKTNELEHRVWGELPLVTLVTSKKGPESTTFTILDSESIQWKGLLTGTGPAFSIFRREKSAKGDSIQILRLPLIGPLYGHFTVQKSDGQHNRKWRGGMFFPRIIWHKLVKC